MHSAGTIGRSAQSSAVRSARHCIPSAGGRYCEARHSLRRQGEMCRCAHECDVLELRLHGVSAHFCGVWRNRRFLRQCICRYVQSIPLDTGACSSAWSKGNNHAGRTVQCRRSRHDRRLRAVFLPLSAMLFRGPLHTACLAMGERGWLHWDCCHALCILPVRCEQRAHDRISGYGLGLRLTYYFHDKHFICFYDPNACASNQFNLTVIDKMLAEMYTVCIDKLRQVKQHGTEKLKKGSISDG